jgi:hypothetical protein
MKDKAGVHTVAAVLDRVKPKTLNYLYSETIRVPGQSLKPLTSKGSSGGTRINIGTNYMFTGTSLLNHTTGY